MAELNMNRTRLKCRVNVPKIQAGPLIDYLPYRLCMSDRDLSLGGKYEGKTDHVLETTYTPTLSGIPGSIRSYLMKEENRHLIPDTLNLHTCIGVAITRRLFEGPDTIHVRHVVVSDIDYKMYMIRTILHSGLIADITIQAIHWQSIGRGTLQAHLLKVKRWIDVYKLRAGI